MKKTIYIQAKHKDKLLFGYLGEANNSVQAMCDVFEEIKNIVKIPKYMDYSETQVIDVTASINGNTATYSFILYYEETDKGFQNEVMHTVLDLIDHLWEDNERG